MSQKQNHDSSNNPNIYEKQNKGTKTLLHELENANDFEEYLDDNAKELMLPENVRALLDRIYNRLQNNGISLTRIETDIGFHKSIVSDVFSAKRSISRDGWIRLLGYLKIQWGVVEYTTNGEKDKNEIDYILKSLGMTPLYPRDPKDAAIIFCLTHPNEIKGIQDAEEFLYDHEIRWSFHKSKRENDKIRIETNG